MAIVGKGWSAYWQPKQNSRTDFMSEDALPIWNLRSYMGKCKEAKRGGFHFVCKVSQSYRLRLKSKICLILTVNSLGNAITFLSLERR